MSGHSNCIIFLRNFDKIVNCLSDKMNFVYRFLVDFYVDFLRMVIFIQEAAVSILYKIMKIKLFIYDEA